MLKNLLMLAGFSTFAVGVIIGLNIYHNYTLSSLPSTTQAHVVPIPDSFDKKTINELKKRIPVKVTIEGKSEITSEDSKSTTISTPTIPTPTSKIASISATPTISISEAPIQP